MLEFLCSLTDAREQRVFELLRQRLNDYFGTLTTEDNVRLESQGQIFLPPRHVPGYYGDIVQIWFRQDSDRAALRNFLLDFLTVLPEAQDKADALKETVCSVLGVKGETEPALTEQPASERGGEILKLLAPQLNA